MIKVKMSISVTGSQGTYTVELPGGIPRLEKENEVSPVVEISGRDVREALYKCYLQSLACILMSESKNSEEFVSNFRSYVNKLELYPDNT